MEDADVLFEVFLDGPYNLRGWDYREAGPMVGGEPVGEILIPTLDWNTPLKAGPTSFCSFL